MVRLAQAIALFIALLPMARSSRSMTLWCLKLQRFWAASRAGPSAVPQVLTPEHGVDFVPHQLQPRPVCSAALKNVRIFRRLVSQRTRHGFVRRIVTHELKPSRGKTVSFHVRAHHHANPIAVGPA